VSASCTVLNRNSLIKRYKLYKTVGLEREFPMTSSVSLALRMTKRWLRCRCLKSTEEQQQQQQPYSLINAPANSLCTPIYLTHFVYSHRCIGATTLWDS